MKKPLSGFTSRATKEKCDPHANCEIRSSQFHNPKRDLQQRSNHRKPLLERYSNALERISRLSEFC